MDNQKMHEFFTGLAQGADKRPCTSTDLHDSLKMMLDNSSFEEKGLRDLCIFGDALQFFSEKDEVTGDNVLLLQAYNGRHSYGEALLRLEFSPTDLTKARYFVGYQTLASRGKDEYLGGWGDIDMAGKTVSEALQHLLFTKLLDAGGSPFVAAFEKMRDYGLKIKPVSTPS